MPLGGNGAKRKEKNQGECRDFHMCKILHLFTSICLQLEVKNKAKFISFLMKRCFSLPAVINYKEGGKRYCYRQNMF